MANIKGITIEIDGNATPLVKELQKVNKEIRESQNDLKELDKLLQMDPGNVEVLAIKQEKLKDAIELTKKKLEEQKTALEQLKSGDQTEATKKQQEALTIEIEKSKQSLKALSDEYNSLGGSAPLEKDIQRLNGEIGNSQNKLKELDALLKLDPSNIELLALKQQELSGAIELTKQKYEEQKAALEQLEAGEQTEATKKQQEALTIEIKKTEQSLKALNNEYKSLGGEVPLEKDIQRLNEEIKDSQDRVKELDELLKLDPGNVELLTLKQKELTEVIELTKQKLEEEKAALEQLKNGEQTEANIKKQEALTVEIEKTKQSLKTLGDEYKEVSSVSGKHIQTIGEEMQKFGGKITEAGKSIAALSTALAGIGTAAVALGTSFDAQMGRVRAISRASAEDFKRLEAKAREMGATTVFTATDSARAMESMALAGWDVDQIIENIGPVMNLAAAAGIDLGHAADICVSSLGGFRQPASECAHLVDVLTAVAYNSNTTVADMGESFRYAATTAGTAKYSFEDVAIAMGAMADSGIKNTMAGRTFRSVINSLVKPTEDQKKAMEALGFAQRQYVTEVDNDKVEKAQKKVAEAVRQVDQAQKNYQRTLKEYGANGTRATEITEKMGSSSTKVQNAHLKLEEATIKAKIAQDKYNEAVKTYGSSSTQAISAQSSFQIAQLKVTEAQNNLAVATKSVTDQNAKYKESLQEYIEGHPRVESAQERLISAQEKLQEAQKKLTEAQQGTNKEVGLQNDLLSTNEGKMKAFRDVMDMLRATLGNTKIEVMDSTGELRDFDDIMRDIEKSGKSMTDMEVLKNAAILFGKQAVSGMLAIVNEAPEKYDKLTAAADNAHRNFDAMAKSLQSTDINWNSILHTDQVQNVDDAFKSFAKSVSDMIVDAKKNGKDMDSVIDNLAKSYGMSAEDAKKAVEVVSEEMQKFSGSAKKAADEMNDNYSGQLKILWSTIQELGLQINDVLKPTIRKWTESLQGVITWFSKLDAGTKETIVWIGAFIAALGPALIIIGSIISAVGKLTTGYGQFVSFMSDKVIPGIKDIGGAFSGLSAGPMALIIAGIAALVAGFIYLWNTNEDFRNKCIEIWESVKAAFQSLWDTIASLLESLKPLFEVVAGVIRDTWTQLCSILAPIFEGAFTIIAAVLRSASDILVGILKVFKGIFTLDWETFWEGIKSIFSGIWELFSGIISGVFTIIKGIVSAFFTWFTNIWSMGWNAVKNLFIAVWDSIVGVFSWVGEKISSIWTSICDFFTGKTTETNKEVSDDWKKLDVVETAEKISEDTTKAWSDMNASVSATNAQIAGDTKTQWSGMTNAVTENTSNMKQTCTVDLRGLKDIATTTSSEIKDNVVSTSAEVKSTVAQTGTDINTSAITAKNNVVSTANNLKTEMKDISGTTASTVKNNWRSMGNGVSSITDKTKNNVTSSWMVIKTEVTENGKELGSTVKGTWNDLSTQVVAASDRAKSGVTNAYSGMQTEIKAKTTDIGKTVSDNWNSSGNSITSATANQTQAIQGKWTGLKTSMGQTTTGIKDDTVRKWSDMNDAIINTSSSKLNQLCKLFEDACAKIKHFLNFEWTLPKIKLPHFTISGKFNMDPPSVPTFSVSWYKKAMNDAYLLNNPTIFGMAGGKLLGGGEAGSEAVVGTAKLGEIVRDAVSAVIGTSSTVIPVYIGQERIEEIVVRANQSINYRSGGR